MISKEEFLKIKTYEEFDRQRNDFYGLDIRDKEIRNHINKLFGEAWAPEEFHQDVKIPEVK